MKRKSKGVAVIAILVGIAVAATLYIASFGKSSSHANIEPANAIAQQAASDAAFAMTPAEAASDAEAHTAAR